MKKAKNNDDFHDFIDLIVKKLNIRYIIFHNVYNMYKYWGSIQKIISLRGEFLKLANGKESLLDILNENEIAEYVYNSNAIENSTLSLEDTEKILLQIDLERFISERELFEAKNLAKVVDYTNKNAKYKELNLDLILFLHKVLISNINDDIAWRFRKYNEWVRVWNHIAVDPKIVVQKLEEALIQYNSTINKNIVERIALLHLNFENIHPFVDWNGRIWRVINNYLLIREWFIPINIKFIDRALYYDAFREFDSKKRTEKMEDIIYKALTNSYHKRLAYLEWHEIITLSEYSKRNKISHSNLINKAKRQTIEAFLEKWVWKIWI